jgi:predicted RNase H-like HicB family nuclease
VPRLPCAIAQGRVVALERGRGPRISVDKFCEQWHFYTMKKVRECVMWDEDGVWTAHAPSVPGVYGLGDTPEASSKDLTEALELMSAYLHDVGEVLPEARSVRLGQVRI